MTLRDVAQFARAAAHGVARELRRCRMRRFSMPLRAAPGVSPPSCALTLAHSGYPAAGVDHDRLPRCGHVAPLGADCPNFGSRFDSSSKCRPSGTKAKSGSARRSARVSRLHQAPQATSSSWCTIPPSHVTA